VDNNITVCFVKRNLMLYISMNRGTYFYAIYAGHVITKAIVRFIRLNCKNNPKMDE